MSQARAIWEKRENCQICFQEGVSLRRGWFRAPTTRERSIEPSQLFSVYQTKIIKMHFKNLLIFQFNKNPQTKMWLIMIIMELNVNASWIIIVIKQSFWFKNCCQPFDIRIFIRQDLGSSGRRGRKKSVYKHVPHRWNNNWNNNKMIKIIKKVFSKCLCLWQFFGSCHIFSSLWTNVSKFTSL